MNPFAFRSSRIFLHCDSPSETSRCRNHVSAGFMEIRRFAGQVRSARFCSNRRKKNVKHRYQRDLRNCILLCDSACVSEGE